MMLFFFKFFYDHILLGLSSALFKVNCGYFLFIVLFFVVFDVQNNECLL